VDEHGGVYSDLDGLFLARIPEPWWRSTWAVGNLNREGDRLGNGVFGAPRGGPLTRECLRRADAEYSAECWECVGPGLMTKVFRGLQARFGWAEVPWQKLIPLTWVDGRWNHLLNAMSKPVGRGARRLRRLLERAVAVHLFSSTFPVTSRAEDPGLETMVSKLQVNRCPLTVCASEPPSLAAALREQFAKMESGRRRGLRHAT